MSSSEPTGTPKRSPLFGISRTRVMSMDKALQTTLQNAVKRWLEKRVEFIESLPEATQHELHEEGLVQPPQVTMPQPAGAKPVANPLPSRSTSAPALGRSRI